MAEEKMGKWRNAPLAYVVAEAVISPLYSLQQYIGPIQEMLRPEYPRMVDGAEFSVELAPGTQSPVQPQQVWYLLTENSGRGVRLGPRAIALHATQYDDFATFARSLSDLFTTIERSKLAPFVERIGLRYVDFILPSDGHQPGDYLVASLRGVTPDGAAPAQHSIWVSSFQFGSCTLSARIAAPSPPGMIMPPNFIALPLQKPSVLAEAEERSKASAPIGFFDTDCSQQIAQMFDGSALSAKFDEMHRHVSASFRAFISQLALKEWI